MDPNTGAENQIVEAEAASAAMRAEAAKQLKSARELAKRVRAEAVHELEDARSRVARITAREEEMAMRWAQLLEAENALTVATKQAASSDPKASSVVDSVPHDPPTLIAEATAEARQILERANSEARYIREDAMRLLAVAEGEKAESREIAQSETERAASEADRLRSDAAEEAQNLREEAERAATTAPGDTSIYAKRGGRKLPRIGEGASKLLSEMSDLRAKSAEEDRQVS